MGDGRHSQPSLQHSGGHGLSGRPCGHAPGKIRRGTGVGSVPTAFAFAAIGAGWADQPILALAASYGLPILLLSVALYLTRRRAL